MADYNKDKGRVQFWESIAKIVAPEGYVYSVDAVKSLVKGKAPTAELNDTVVDLWKSTIHVGAMANLERNQILRLKELAAAFEVSAGVMPVANDNVYAAKRLAEAVVAIAKVPNGDGLIDTGVTDVISYYVGDATKLNEAGIKPQAQPRPVALCIPTGDETDGILKGNFGQTIAAADDDQGKQIRELYIEDTDIDLLPEIQKSEMAVEGQRRTGILPYNYDALGGADVFLKDDEVLGKIWFSDDGDIERVECPLCEQSDVYSIGLGHYGCFVCDKEFKVPLEMGDMRNGE